MPLDPNPAWVCGTAWQRDTVVAGTAGWGSVHRQGRLRCGIRRTCSGWYSRSLDRTELPSPACNDSEGAHSLSLSECPRRQSERYPAMRQTNAPLRLFLNTPCLKRKTVQYCYCQNFVKFPLVLIIFWQKDGKKAKIMWGALIFHLT